MPYTEFGGAVTFVNRFLLHGSAEEFERVFAATSEFMGRRPGFLWHLLLRPMDTGMDTATGRHYVNIAAWRDEASFRAAVGHPEFAPHAGALRALSTSEPALYETRQSRAAAAVRP
ncbi:antibiotic biosynthesis monooxygenase [Microbispora sp. RL4-1S]|uniref:Antibiotic biosynthesis monooxygenase n=1 Tax=Microbispora oryzae TaxID=2806554 RepID=A0A941ANR2_9ACTN|nr:antibiotic biosynthesis monooxygenase family protein [Microbispora oryzae]MBP2702959.1 antibiotic biosynthesis monooxygenase [Microbispora oryzae]